MWAYYKALINVLEDLSVDGPSNESEFGQHRAEFVMIIDEINRANLTQVFGELMTVIEASKRAGESEAVKLRLSDGTPFELPPNLHIIGTMNTTDHSVSQIDLALRRRFEFERIGPLYDLDALQQIDFADKLRSMNARIRELTGNADYEIGHAYFLPRKEGDEVDVLQVMRRQILPLLQQYLDYDNEQISAVLEEGGFSPRLNEDSGQLIIGNNDSE